MPSKILSFICHVPGMAPGAYPAVPTSSAASPKTTERKTDSKADSKTSGGHFTAIYENDRFVRFKYISNN
ncbi:allophanate hydrolase subunit 1 [Hymenobacter luteus]|uniref:Allophanate hydrolase subunit 1 n=2 Tax=Hymenobacter TaxID=89966 RepID=A0A7W9WC21_9BACT|nr:MULTISPECIES: hypothetical protein [Hymenobacter]MBB4600867.1 allophanate hydrolase subunit 1 [Hymenobacter latericoloratus]MBB6058926.1 allophanate hydrolase subunit 1 [Hymenobacter luteus]